MTTTLTLGPVGIERAAFREDVRLAQHPQTGDGAAPAATPRAVAAIAPQPVPSPPAAVQTMTGSTR